MESPICDECSSAIEARSSVAVQGSSFDDLVNLPGARYVRAYKGGAVRLENNTFAAATKAFEVTDSGAPVDTRSCRISSRTRPSTFSIRGGHTCRR